ncbi:MAG: hydrogenase formation protein HypD [Ectothiorhodospiraceae bacterium]|nr:hydrogenase formation protein HypD [Ectothiorhodospiraceae bacterium]
MRLVDEFRDPTLARALAARIAREASPHRTYRIMEFCGGHTHAIFRHGLHDLLPPNVRYVHGPGCPVCVLPVARVDAAIELVERHGVILATYGDMMRVPGSDRRSLLAARAAGADVRMVGSTLDALQLARTNRDREVVFLAIGFETTTPPTAVAVRAAAAEELGNFTVFCNHVLTPPAMDRILEDSPDPEAPGVAIDAVLGPSHVSTIIGTTPYAGIAARHRRPVVITGFEPLDVMQATLMAIRQLNAGRHEVENQYTRVVTRDGNGKARALVADVLEVRPRFEWRGLGTLASSALQLRERYAAFDAERRFALTGSTAREVRGCACPEVLRGVTTPPECKLFGTVCTPDNPMGACMVSSEGACAAYWSYGRHRRAAEPTAREIA